MIRADHWLAGFLLLTTAGCGDLLGLGNDFPRLWIRETGIVLDVGEEAQLSARIHHEERDSIRTALDAMWSTPDSDVIRLDADGHVTALAPGEATVRVERGGVRDAGTVVVRGDGQSYSARWQSVDVGDVLTCALTVEGRAFCWGWDYWGAIGDGTLRRWTLAYAPVEVASPERFTDIAVGPSHACALSVTGIAFCWGQALKVGQRDGDLDPILAPQRVAFDRPITHLSTGDFHTCFLDQEGRAYCWGMNPHGEIGDGASGIQNHRYRPTPVDSELRFQQIVAGAGRTCALDLEGFAHCWGKATEVTPTPVPGGHRFTQITGELHGCGLTAERRTWCWSSNQTFQLGTDAVGFSPTPVPMEADPSFMSITGGVYHTCGILADGAAMCWGGNRLGQLGTEATVARNCAPTYELPCTENPVPVAGGHRFTQLSTGLHTTCGVTVDKALYCWGTNEFAQLGNGRIVDGSGVPVRVVDPVN